VPIVFVQVADPAVTAGFVASLAKPGGNITGFTPFEYSIGAKWQSRLPMMHRHGWQGPRASSSIAFAWFVWDRAHRGKTELDRI
jgi:hypothetical protein